MYSHPLCFLFKNFSRIIQESPLYLKPFGSAVQDAYDFLKSFGWGKPSPYKLNPFGHGGAVLLHLNLWARHVVPLHFFHF